METIFHEKQEGQLCAQHALNALLQGAYFTAVDLGTIAAQLDEEERKNMAEAGINSDEYKQFIAAGSNNMDDSGFFSVQVLERALRVWQLELIPFKSKNSISDHARKNPTCQKAYICNYHEHWFTIRKIGSQWFNLNSLLSGPDLISDTYLSLFLTQLESEGYTVFVVNGILPESRADDVLSKIKIDPIPKPKISNVKTEAVKLVETTYKGSDGFTDEERNELKDTIAKSLKSREEEDQRQFEMAMALSIALSKAESSQPSSSGSAASQQQSSSSLLNEPSTSGSIGASATVTSASNVNTTSNSINANFGLGFREEENFLTEEEMLEAALQMSLEAT